MVSSGQLKRFTARKRRATLARRFGVSRRTIHEWIELEASGRQPLREARLARLSSRVTR